MQLGIPFQIVAVAARSLESAQQFAEKHGAEKAYGSYESIAADPEVGMLVLCFKCTVYCNCAY